MRRARWLASWKESAEKPVFYHCVSRVVERRFAFGPEEKEKFRMFMRMQENFTGCRVVAYCLMCNHIHLLLEVPPLGESGLSDEALLKRLSALYSEAFVAVVTKELADAREFGMEKTVSDIHERFTYRMHDLGEFMKGLLQRFTQWFNRTHSRTGTLWEQRFKSVIVEDGIAAKTIAAYIDLNPVRAGMVGDPADYRYSSYGEAMGGRKKAQAGLVRAMRAHKGYGPDWKHWSQDVSREYRMLLLEGAVEKLEVKIGTDGGQEVKRTRKGMSVTAVNREREMQGRVSLGKMLRCRVRYFTDGAVIGSRGFVDDAFNNARTRFGEKRKNGARKLQGDAAPAAGILWTLRDLKKGVSTA
mgnify:CR=1 FL=1